MLFQSGGNHSNPKGPDSMSTSILYHAFGIHDYEHVKTVFQDGRVTFTARNKRASDRCSVCGCWSVIRHGEQERTFGWPARARFAAPTWPHPAWGTGANLRMVSIGSK